jgi:hypothetical protein
MFTAAERTLIADALQVLSGGEVVPKGFLGTLFGAEPDDVRFQAVLWRDARLGASTDIAERALSLLTDWCLSPEDRSTALAKINAGPDEVRVLRDRLRAPAP